MTHTAVHTRGEVPRHRIHCAYSVVGNRLFVLGGGLADNENDYHPLNTIDILNLGMNFFLFAHSPSETFIWETQATRGDAPLPCRGLNVCAYGKRLLKYGGVGAQGSLGMVSVLNSETLVWEAEIDLQVLTLLLLFCFY